MIWPKIGIMIIGSRVLYPEEVDIWSAEVIQISVYRGMKDNMDIMMNCVRACRKAGIRYVIHPVSYSLLDDGDFSDLLKMAAYADLSLILHDERSPGGERLEGPHDIHFRRALEELKSITAVSFENAADTGDIRWFWNNYADSVTLDIGHVEAAGFNSVEFVRAFGDDPCIENIRFVHMHRNNGLHGGITDHWPLRQGCRELEALKELIKIKPDVMVILEINEIEEIEESLNLLRELRDRQPA